MGKNGQISSNPFIFYFKLKTVDWPVKMEVGERGISVGLREGVKRGDFVLQTKGGRKKN